jgi:hypothetical protein
MEIVMELDDKVVETDKRLSVHEAVCAERYEKILDSFSKGAKRMERMEYLLYATIASIFFGKDFLVETIKKVIA